MIFNKNLLIVICCFICINIPLMCEYANTDSLIKELKSSNRIDKKLAMLIEIIENKLDNLDSDNIKYLNEAFKLAQTSGDEEKQALIHQYLGEYWKIFGNFEKSADNLFKAINYYENNNNKKNMALSYINLAETYRAETSYKKAIEFLEKAQIISTKINDTLTLARTYNRLAAVFYEIQDGSLKHKSIEMAEEANNLIDPAVDYKLYISNLLIIGAVYRDYSKYDTAEKKFLLALKLADENKDVYNYPSILTNLADNFFRKGDYQEALKYGMACYDFRNEKKLLYMEPYLYENLSKVCYALKDYKNSAFFLQMALDTKDTLFEIRKHKSIVELQTKYETRQKEEELKDRKTREMYQLIIFIITIVLLIAIVYQFYSKQKILKQKNSTISKQNEQLNELNITKDKFFSIIAHDLKSPISAFRGITDLLEEQFDTLDRADSKEFITLMKNSAGHLSMLLENLLTWSRSQRGKIEYSPDKFSVKTIVNDNVNIQSLAAQKKNISLETSVEADMDAMMDINMINTVLRNLISNAIKFTPIGGSISVSVVLEKDNLLFSVKDSGVGIPEDDADKLFDLGNSFTTPGTENERGTGLGLIICKEFIEKHNGKIWLESQPNKGSTFYFTIPVTKEN